MKANPEHQKVLLDLADLDQRRARAVYAQANPPQAARVGELTSLRQEQLRELTVLSGTRDDVQAELGRIEADVAVVQQRRDRDAERLSQSANAKDAVAFEQELTSLARRLSELEDQQLDAMGRLEDAEAAVSAQQALIAATTEEGARLSAEAKALIAAAEAEIGHLSRDRVALADSTSPSLFAEYERRAARGVGAALLRAGTCEGCRMVLAGTDLNAIRQADADEVLSCPECGCILVRTEESGL